jgi:hypothetical protein
MRARESVHPLHEKKISSLKDMLPIEIVRKAAEEPTRWIAQNAGLEGSVVAAKIKETKDKHWGFNAQTEEYEDLVKAGVIDPTKVVRAIVQVLVPRTRDLLRYEPGRLYLQCSECGRETPGWRTGAARRARAVRQNLTDYPGNTTKAALSLDNVATRSYIEP